MSTYSQNDPSIALYMHAGSGNHGCEAIVDSLTRLLTGRDSGGKNAGLSAPGKIRLVSCRADEDKKYLPGKIRERLDIVSERRLEDHPAAHVFYYALRKVTKDYESYLRYRLKAAGSPKLAVSIGGDNYCYDSMIGDCMLANGMFKKKGAKTVLLGCSVEPSLLMPENRALIHDLKRYDLILARESITCDALKEALGESDKLRLVPDPAFTLPADIQGVPEDIRDRLKSAIERGGTAGLNLSPLAGEYAKNPGALTESFRALIQRLLDTTDMDIALIPHVVWENNDDRKVLSNLAGMFEGQPRVYMVPDLPAEQLKGVISQCRFFIGARTHATIAAYSSLVPTLVLGYSVKAKGIAKDLFGTDEGYVLPVQSLEDPGQLTQAAAWLMEKEEEIRQCLSKVMPEYTARASEAAQLLRRCLNE